MTIVRLAEVLLEHGRVNDPASLIGHAACCVGNG